MDMVGPMYKHVCGVTVSSAPLGFAHLLVCPLAGKPIAPPMRAKYAAQQRRIAARRVTAQ